MKSISTPIFFSVYGQKHIDISQNIFILVYFIYVLTIICEMYQQMFSEKFFCTHFSSVYGQKNIDISQNIYFSFYIMYNTSNSEQESCLKMKLGPARNQLSYLIFHITILLDSPAGKHYIFISSDYLARCNRVLLMIRTVRWSQAALVNTFQQRDPSLKLCHGNWSLANRDLLCQL